MFKSCVALHFELQNDDTTWRFNHVAVLLVVCFFLENQEGVWGKGLKGKGLGARLRCGALTPCRPYHLFALVFEFVKTKGRLQAVYHGALYMPWIHTYSHYFGL